MEKVKSEIYSLIYGIALMFMGFLSLVIIRGTIRYVGVVFLIVAVFFLILYIKSAPGNGDEENFKSHTREQVRRLKHQ